MLSMSPEAVAASEMIGQGTKKRELMNKERMKAVAMLIGWVKNGHLPYRSIAIVAKSFGVAHNVTFMASDMICMHDRSNYFSRN